MTEKTTNRNADDREVPIAKQLDDLYTLIDGMEVAMFTTRRPDGRLVSRPMQTQKHEPGVDLWFVTDIDTHKLDELEHDPNVNLAYYKDGTREWVSVSGTARVVRDRAKIRELYKPDWRAWFGDEGGDRNGGPDDPRMALIEVEARSVTYQKKDRPMAVAAFSIVKGIATGKPAKTGDLRQLGERELGQDIRRE